MMRKICCSVLLFLIIFLTGCNDSSIVNRTLSETHQSQEVVNTSTDLENDANTETNTESNTENNTEPNTETNTEPNTETNIKKILIYETLNNDEIKQLIDNAFKIFLIYYIGAFSYDWYSTIEIDGSTYYLVTDENITSYSQLSNLLTDTYVEEVAQQYADNKFIESSGKLYTLGGEAGVLVDYDNYKIANIVKDDNNMSFHVVLPVASEDIETAEELEVWEFKIVFNGTKWLVESNEMVSGY